MRVLRHNFYWFLRLKIYKIGYIKIDSKFRLFWTCCPSSSIWPWSSPPRCSAATSPWTACLQSYLSFENPKTAIFQFHYFNLDTAVAFLKMSMFGLVQIRPVQLQSRAEKKFWLRSQQNFKIKDEAWAWQSKVRVWLNDGAECGNSNRPKSESE